MRTSQELLKIKEDSLLFLSSGLLQFRIMGGAHGVEKTDKLLPLISQMADALHNFPKAVSILETETDQAEGSLLSWAIWELERGTQHWKKLCQEYQQMVVTQA